MKTTDSENALVHVDVIDGPIDEVWAAFTTKEGQESWMVAHSEIDLTLGGLMKTHYDPSGQIGDSQTIENEILSFEPPRMISFRVVTFPADFPFPNAIREMWTVIYFEPINAQSTSARIACLGFGPDQESQMMRAFFDRGNALTLERLQEHFRSAV